ncbi:hypothetical protein Hanom_Chr12g01180081 [Helianthus anomalus]
MLIFGVEVEEERDGMKIVEVLKDVVLMILLYQLAINGFPAVQTGYPASPVDSAAYTKGNPYLIDGCIEGEHDVGDPTEECRRCRDHGGICGTDNIYGVDGSLFSQTFTCQHYNRISLGVILDNRHLPLVSSVESPSLITNEAGSTEIN